MGFVLLLAFLPAVGCAMKKMAPPPPLSDGSDSDRQQESLFKGDQAVLSNQDIDNFDCTDHARGSAPPRSSSPKLSEHMVPGDCRYRRAEFRAVLEGAQFHPTYTGTLHADSFGPREANGSMGKRRGRRVGGQSDINVGLALPRKHVPGVAPIDTLLFQAHVHSPSLLFQPVINQLFGGRQQRKLHRCILRVL